MKRLALFFIFLALVSMGQSILKNGDFQKGMANWSISDWKQKKGEVTVKDGVLLISNPDDACMTMVQQGVKLEANVAYQLKYKMKCEEVRTNGKKPSGALILGLENGKTVLEHSDKGMWRATSGTFDWKELECRIAASPKERNWVFYGMLRGSSGSLFLKEIQLIPIPQIAAADSAIVDVYPALYQKGTANILAGHPAIWLLKAKCEKPKNGDVLECEIFLPDGIEFLGATPFWGNMYEPGKWVSHVENVTAKTAVQGGTLYRFSCSAGFARLLSEKQHYWRGYMRVYVQAALEAKGGKASFQLIKNGKTFGHAQQIQVNVLPELNKPTAKVDDFQLQVCSLFSVNVPLPGVREAFTRYWTDMAVRPLTNPPFQFHVMDEESRKMVFDNFDIMVMLSGQTPLGGFDKWQAKHPDIPLSVDEKGKTLNSACASFMADNPNSLVFDDYVPNLVRTSLKNCGGKVKAFILDIEPGANRFCFCENCRRQFAQRYKIDKVPSIEEINAKHSANWFEYRLKQNAEMSNNLANAIRRAIPGMAVIMCTDPLHAKPPHLQQWCCMDIRMMDQGQYDMFMNMPYYGGLEYYDDFAFNVRTLKTPQFPLVDPSEDMEMFYSRYTPVKIFMNIIATATLGGKGIGIWPSDALDAGYLHSIRNAISRVAETEAFYSAIRCDDALSVKYLNTNATAIEDNGKQSIVYSPDFPATTRYTLYRKNKAYLATVFNYSTTEEIIAEISIPEAKGAYSVRELVSRRNYGTHDISKGFTAEISPENVAMFLLEPAGEQLDLGAFSVFDAEVLLAKVSEFKRNASEKQRFAPVANGECSASLGLLPDISKPLVKLSCGKRSIYLDSARGAAVVSWKTDAFNDVLMQMTRGTLDEPLLYQFPGNIAFDLTSIEATSDSATAQFSFKAPAPTNASTDDNSLYGLEILKQVRLEQNGTRIVSTYTFANRREAKGKSLKVGWRLKNYPRLGASFLKEKPLSSYWHLNVPVGGNVLRFTAGELNSSNFFFTPNAMNSAKYDGTVKSRNYAGQPILLTASDAGQSHSLTFIPDKDAVDGIMVWWCATDASTVEPLFDNSTIKPGEQFTVKSIIEFK